MFYHLLLIGIGVGAWVAAGGALSRLDHRSKFLPVLYGLGWAGLLGTVGLGYLLAFSGEVILGVPITFPMFKTYLGQFADLARVAGLDPGWAGLLAALFPLSLTAGCLLFRTQLWVGTQHLAATAARVFRLLADPSPARARRRLHAGWITGAVLGLLTYKLYLASATVRLQAAQEPLYRVYFSSALSGISVSGPLEPYWVRANYPKNLPFAKKNVILIVVDALRADYLPAYGCRQTSTPFLDGLAQTGHLHRIDHAFSASTSSFPGIMSLLRSKTWPQMAVNSFGLHDLLKDQGYRVHFILGGDHTNFFDIKSLYGKSVDYYFDGTHSQKHYINDDEVLLEGLGRPSSPAFYYFHLMSVHSLGLRHPVYVGHRPADATDLDVTHYRNNYRNGIRQADYYLSRLFGYFQKHGLLKNSLVVITADHGESLGEGGVFSHNNAVTNRETRIPLFIYDPEGGVRYRTDHAIQADVGATIVDRLGLPIPATWEGESLLAPSRRRVSYHCMKDSYALIEYTEARMLKYLYLADTGREFIYDLGTDPAESRNLLATTEPATLAQLRRQMKQFVARTKGRTTL